MRLKDRVLRKHEPHAELVEGYVHFDKARHGYYIDSIS
jgi:hypothetical protein